MPLGDSDKKKRPQHRTLITKQRMNKPVCLLGEPEMERHLNDTRQGCWRLGPRERWMQGPARHTGALPDFDPWTGSPMTKQELERVDAMGDTGLIRHMCQYDYLFETVVANGHARNVCVCRPGKIGEAVMYIKSSEYKELGGGESRQPN